MSTQTVKFEYDQQRNILFTEDDFEVNGPEDADALCLLYQRQFERIGRPVHVVSKIDGLLVAAPASEYYGNKCRELARGRVLQFARYGENSVARMSVRTSALKARFEANIFNSREEAVAAVTGSARTPPAAPEPGDGGAAAAQKVSFEYDPLRNILFAVDDFEISTEQDVEAFLEHYRRQLGALKTKPYLIACIDGLRVSSKVDEYYGRRVKEVVGSSLLGFARYGSNAVSRMSVRTAALKSGFEINIFDSLKRAVEEIERMKSRPPAAADPG